MTADRLAEIRARADAATDDVGLIYDMAADEWHVVCDKATSRLLMHAPEDVPWLMAQLDEQMDTNALMYRSFWEATDALESRANRAEAALSRVREALDDMSGEMSAGAYLTLYAALTEETK